MMQWLKISVPLPGEGKKRSTGSHAAKDLSFRDRPNQVIRNRVQDVLRVSPGIQEIRNLVAFGSPDPTQVQAAMLEQVGKSEEVRPSLDTVLELSTQLQSASPQDAELARNRLVGAATSRVMGQLEVGNLVRNIGERLTETNKPDEVARYQHDLRLITTAFLSPKAANSLQPLFDSIEKLKEPTRLSKLRVFLGRNQHGTSHRNALKDTVQRLGMPFDVAANPIHAHPQARARWEQKMPWEDKPLTSEQIVANAYSGGLFNPITANAVDKDTLRAGIDDYGSYAIADDTKPLVLKTPIDVTGREISLTEQYFTKNAAIGTAIAGAVVVGEVIGGMPQGTPVHQGPLHDDKATSVMASAPAQNTNGLNVNVDGQTDIFRALKQLANAPSNVMDAITRDLQSQQYVKAYRDATKLKDGVLKDDLLLALAPEAVQQANESGIAADSKYMDKALAHLAKSPGIGDAAINLRGQLDAPISSQSITGS